MHTIAPNTITLLEQIVDQVGVNGPAVVEVGAGTRSLAASPMYEHFCSRGLFLALNIDPRQHAALQTRQRYDQVRREGFQEVLVDSSELHLLGELAVNKVIVANVIGEPHSLFAYESKPDINPTGADYQGATNSRDKRDMLRVMHQVARPQAELDIWETITPPPVPEILEVVEATGWGVPSASVRGEPGFAALQQLAGLENDDGRHHPPAFIAARKL